MCKVTSLRRLTSHTPPAGGSDMDLGGDRSVLRLDIGGVSNTGGGGPAIPGPTAGMLWLGTLATALIWRGRRR